MGMETWLLWTSCFWQLGLWEPQPATPWQGWAVRDLAVVGITTVGECGNKTSELFPF